MIIAIDGTTLVGRDGGPGAGVEEYTRRVVAAMVEGAEVRRGRRGAQREVGVFVVRPMGRVPFFSRHVSVPMRAALARADVLFCPSGHIPLGWYGRAVIVVHDLAIHEHPEWFPGKASPRDARSIHLAEKIIAVSEATRQQIGRLFPDALAKTVVIYPGAGEPTTYNLQPTNDPQPTTHNPQPTDRVLFVSTIEPRKNLVNAIAAFDAFLRMHPDRAATTRFVLAGRVGWKAEPILEAIARTNETWREAAGGDVVEQRGYVSAEEKTRLYAESSCLFFPSLYEGFGLPVLEAMAAGLPVITSDRGALPEVGGDAVMYVEPDAIEQMAFALAQCLLLPEAMEEMVAEGRKRAGEFGWGKCAERVLSVLAEN